MTTYQCAIPTQTLGHCKRPASVHYCKADGTCVAHVCKQHAAGAGAARLLLPYPWEYDHREFYGKDSFDHAGRDMEARPVTNAEFGYPTYR